MENIITIIYLCKIYRVSILNSPNQNTIIQ